MTYKEIKELYGDLLQEEQKKGFKKEEANELVYNAFKKMYALKKIDAIGFQYAIDISRLKVPFDVLTSLDKVRDSIKKIYSLDKMEKVIKEDVKEEKYVPLALFSVLGEAYQDGTYNFAQLEQMAFALNISLNEEFLLADENKRKEMEIIFHPRYKD